MSAALTSHDVIVIKPLFQFQWEEVQQCFVLLYPEGMIKLNGSAGEILALCDGKRNIKAIISCLENKYPGNDLTDDVFNFLEDAYAKGWLRKNTGQ